MKLLLTADLHSHREWYTWLLDQVPKYAAVAMAGDLLDMFQDLPPQIEFLRAWVVKMKLAGTPLFLCDGNHDMHGIALPWPTNPDERPSPEQAGFIERAQLAEHWMDALVEEGATIVSGMAKAFPELEGLIVTSLLYGSDNEETNASLMEKGAQLRRASPRSPWLVLHHEPPVGFIGRPELGNRLFGDWIEEYQPTLACCGHDHDSPFLNSTCVERVSFSHVFNPGYREGRYPCHIEIDMATMKYSWAH